MSTNRQVSTPGLVVLFIGAAALVAMNGPPTPHSNQNVQAPEDPTDCPHYWGPYLVEHLHSRTLSVPGGQTSVPEYNDCQRFLLRKDSLPHNRTVDSLKIGEHEVVFAREHLDLAYPNETPLPADISGFPFSKMIKNRSPTTHLAFIGEVLSFGDYSPLGIKKGYDCLVLQWDDPPNPSGDQNLQAWMVPVPLQNEHECGPANSPLNLSPAGATPLEVTVLQAEVHGGEKDVAPPVARWDWDKKALEHYIGILCPTGWCEIHRSGYTSSPTYSVPEGMPTPNGTRLNGPDGSFVRQKGWYDEEWLAAVGSTPSTPALDGAWGTVMPVPTSMGKARAMSEFNNKGWVPVAWVALDIHSNGFENKYNFLEDHAAKGEPLGSVRNRIDLCFEATGGSSLCLPKPAKPCTSTPDAVHTGHWYARVTAAGHPNVTKSFCVDYQQTDWKNQPPNIVRWRWIDTDPTVWISCPAGCCQVTPPK